MKGMESLDEIGANLDRVAFRSSPAVASAKLSYRRRLRQYVMLKYGDGHRVPCVFCGAMLSNESMTLDRIVPGARGGRYMRDNVQPACAPCNQGRGHSSVEDVEGSVQRRAERLHSDDQDEGRLPSA